MKPPAPQPSSGLRRYFRHIHHLSAAQRQFIGGFLAGAAYSVSSGVGLPVMVKTMLSLFFGKKEEAPPVVVAFSQHVFGEHYSDKLLIVACVALPVIFLIRSLVCANRYRISAAGFHIHILDSLRQQVFEKRQRLPLAFYQLNKSGDLSARLMGDTDQLKIRHAGRILVLEQRRIVPDGPHELIY